MQVCVAWYGWVLGPLSGQMRVWTCLNGSTHPYRCSWLLWEHTFLRTHSEYRGITPRYMFTLLYTGYVSLLVHTEHHPVVDSSTNAHFNTSQCQSIPITHTDHILCCMSVLAMSQEPPAQVNIMLLDLNNTQQHCHVIRDIIHTSHKKNGHFDTYH